MCVAVLFYFLCNKLELRWSYFAQTFYIVNFANKNVLKNVKFSCYGNNIDCNIFYYLFQYMKLANQLKLKNK